MADGGLFRGESVECGVDGMHCAGCAARLERALADAPGVMEVSVNFAAERARATLAPGADPRVIASTIREAGYRPEETTVTLRVEGMHCASCVGRVERALAGAPGVLEARVNLADGTARARVLGDGAARAPALAEAATRAGYAASVAEDGSEARAEADAAKTREARSLRRDVIIAAIATIPVTTLEMGSHLVPAMHHWVEATIGAQTARIAAFVLTAIVLAGPGRRFYAAGARTLLRGAPDMNALVMLGTAAAFGFSTVATFRPDWLPEGARHVYFEAAAVIVTLILLGRWFEARAKGRTSDAIRRLVALRPDTARVVRDGAETELALSEVAVGDVIAVRPGERLPVDGAIVEGETHIDESMVTGEPIPAAKRVGDSVIGGSVNRNGAIRLRAEKVGSDTLLARIVQTVEAAQAAKLPIQALVDRVTLVFVPAVMAAALLTFGAWMVFGPEPALSLALVNAVAVLIIACPCAMGLATPTSIMVGTGRAAELGVLFRKGEALQALRDARVVALDKTGTLTEGRPALTDVALAEGWERDDALRLVAAVEARSEHPIAEAIVEAASAEGLALPAVERFEAEPGRGARAVVEGRAVAVGSRRMMTEAGIDLSGFGDAPNRLAREGKTPLFAAVDGAAIAALAVSDPVKETTPEALDALRAAGLSVVMVTGDARRTAEAVARRLGVDQVVAEVLPTDKAEVVSRLRRERGAVAFVGDGVNDAPALAEADVGIAIGTGTDIAVESAEIVLMSGDLRGVATAHGLSRATIRNIRQNLGWAFGYNALLIPVAAGALQPAFGITLSPMLAGLAMALSSVSVVTNALRLRRAGPETRNPAARARRGERPRAAQPA